MAAILYDLIYGSSVEGLLGEVNFNLCSSFMSLYGAPFAALLNPLLVGAVSDNAMHYGLLFTPLIPSNGAVMETIFNSSFNSSIWENNSPRTNFAGAFRAVVEGLTKSVRDADMLINGTKANNQVEGLTSRSMIFVRVHFEWLFMPITLWALSIAILTSVGL